jgi:putative nucleotidyltransferase with HDIG domain
MSLYDQFVRDLAQSATLPSRPQVLGHLVAALGSEDAGLREIAHLVRQDPVLAGQVMRVANSAAYAARRELLAVEDALMRIGLAHTRRLVLALSLQNMVASPGLLAHQCSFWEHSLGVAHAAEVVVRHAAAIPGVDQEAGYLLGLFHDVGLLALAGRYPEALAEVQRFAERSELPYYAAEPSVLATHHGALGAVLARHWHLPDLAVDVIRGHHGLEPVAPALAPVLQVLQLAECLSDQAGVTGPGEGWLAPIDPLGLDALGLRPEGVEDLVWEIRGAIEQTSGALAYAR